MVAVDRTRSWRCPSKLNTNQREGLKDAREQSDQTHRLCATDNAASACAAAAGGSLGTAGAMAVLRVNVDDYAEIWVNGELPRAAGRTSPGTIQGFNMPSRLVLSRTVAPNDQFEIAVFAINGPISAAPANFLWFREAKDRVFPLNQKEVPGGRVSGHLESGSG